MNHELRNFFRRCVDPIFFVRATVFFGRRALFSLQYRYLPSRWYYPKAVREAFNKVMELASHNSPSPGRRPPSPLGRGEGEGKHRGGRLKLATGFFEYDGEPDWQKKFDDIEQTMSLHRWGWLIYDGMDKEQGLALIRSWLAAMGAVPKGIAGTPYAVSERIVNALQFLPREGGIPGDLIAQLLSMAYHVARNIEYHGIRATGNHLVNNARALFFAGQLLRVKELSDLALAIVAGALPWLVLRDGFLREESSHYHLLFTRWIIEIYELAKDTHHHEMENFLESRVEKLTKQCWFFLMEDSEGKRQIPLIGDVSPDCTPEWLIKYLTPYLDQYTPPPPIPLPRGEGGRRPGEGKMRAYPESGWFRLDYGSITIFWHIPQNNMIHRATHGHADLCSFVLFYDGKPMLIDPGRPTYQGDEGCLARNHNALTVDGFDPFLYDRAQKFPAFYQRRYAQVDWEEDGKEFVFSISHNGFYRIKGDRIDHVRRFRVGNDYLMVEDELPGKHTHTVKALFHLAPGADKIDLQHSAGERQIISGWTSPAYGVKINSPVIVVSHKDNTPLTRRCKITL